MLITKQNDFDSFNCIAEQCPESCCKFWQIVPDDASIERYRSMLKEDPRIRNVVDENSKTLRQNGRICGFLDEDELCYLQKTYGEDMLCETCFHFPRHMEEFENVREYSLSLSCPHAASLLLNSEKKMMFDTSETDEEEEYEEFDYYLYDKLLYAREALYKVAQDRSVPLWIRMDKIIKFGVDFQALIDEDRLFEADEMIRAFENEKDHPENETFHMDYDFEKRAFSVLFELEELHEDWMENLDTAWKTFFEINIEKSFSDTFLKHITQYETAGEQILMLLIYTYFCGSVYDGWAYSKLMLSVYSVKWIFMIAFAMETKKSVLVKTAYQYAREIEHSDQNLDVLEEWFMDNR